MKLTYATALLSVALGAARTSAKACSGEECVSYFHGANCQATNYISDYVPTCAGNCFQYNSFDSLYLTGNSILGTDCHAYSDSNCQNQIADSGNIVHQGCLNSPGAKSMKCYYNC
ncbi:hypothetical protein FB451DRAFT_1406485 [Mycena latifolia]|nr:hypothetical protein FB451DRAFT_1406485 [Mycena latifolia]